MEDFELMVKDMNKHIKTADHLLYMTYPLVKDNKLIIAIAENILLALKQGIEAVLYYDRLFKRIPPYPENFYSKFQIFKEKCVIRYNFERKQIELIQDIINLFEDRKESTMEFVRKDKYVFFSNAHRTQTISIDKLKEFITTAKPFIEKINRIYYGYITRR